MAFLTDFIHEHSTSVDMIKATPPVSVTTLTLMGHSVSDVLVVLTIIYTSCMLFVLIRDKFIGHYRNGNKEAVAKDE